MPTARLVSADTNVKVDVIGEDEVQLVLYNIGQDTVVISGTVDSVLMVADRINDRLHSFRRA